MAGDPRREARGGAGTMSVAELIQRLWRKAEIVLPSPAGVARVAVWRLRGASIGRGTRLPSCRVTWPHQVRIGEACELHPGIFFNYSHYWTPGPSILIGNRVFLGAGIELNCSERIEIADDVMIATGCRLVDSDHGMRAGLPPRDQPLTTAPIFVGRGAWLGTGVTVLKGVRVGEGAVIGAGSVVTKSVPPGEIWAGVPARKIGERS